MLGRRWSYGGGAGVARRELRAAMATAELRELGGYACGKKKTEAKQMGCAVECGRALGRLRRALAWLCHAGQGAGDARPSLATTRRTGSEPIGHRAGRFS